MKIYVLIAVFATVIGTAGLPFSATGGEPAKPTAKPIIAATHSAPFANYWDAKVWDRSGGAFFWHKRTEDRPVVKRSGQTGQNPRAAKSARASSPLSNR